MTIHASSQTFASPAEKDLNRGYGTLSREAALFCDGLAATTGHLLLNFFTPDRDLTLSKVRLNSTATVSATPTIVRVGLYKVTANGLGGTLVASTPNDTTIGGTANTTITKNLSVAYEVTAGQTYAMGLLVLAGTMPTFAARTVFFDTLADLPRLKGLLTGLSDLGASYLNSSFVATTDATCTYFKLLTSEA